ncbi:acyltransferase [Brevibacillus choshinensis]|uniref:Acetyltransferase n=1 Tax=Brevibacillus choshinensis TaxID=54911 RepID=A0ABR5N755_BRECH|nr:acyltransferase [Brevibacillus choshinensis]KQL46473.1 acetyltransferase [Brevibacillus choshinensis]MED4586140.1 acyltransferase [Brevibacillus choshinensis]MED4754715.1 acyltransferase [Brevibacillus choshinensis]MED4780454.1 acyltransferase [Brevibacillus choshinensis]
MRNTTRYPVHGANPLWQLYQTVSFWKVMKNFIVIQLARYTPFLSWKNWLYRTFLRMEVGQHSAVALMVMMDVMFPELIKIGRNCVIGYNTTILAHEYLVEEYRLGEVRIEDDVLIGANSTILPGVTIGKGAIVAAGTVVHKDVSPGAFVGGNPMQVIRSGNATGDEQD